MSDAAGALDPETANAVRERCTARVRKMLCEIVGADERDARRLLPNDAPLDQWNADSLDHLELIVSIEDEFDVDILEIEAPELDTVAKLVDHILKGPSPKAAIA